MKSISFNSTVIEDLEVLNRISESKIRKLAAQLLTESHILSETRISQIITNFIKDPAESQSLKRAIVNLEVDELPEFLEFVSSLDKMGVIKERLKPKEIPSLLNKLKLLVKKYPALETFKKAERLKKAIGSRLQDAQVICDLRPVMDTDAHEIVGFIPCTIMKVMIDDEGEVKHVHEIQLNRDEISDLRQKLDRALTKLDTLERFVAEPTRVPILELKTVQAI